MDAGLRDIPRDADNRFELLVLAHGDDAHYGTFEDANDAIRAWEAQRASVAGQMLKAGKRELSGEITQELRQAMDERLQKVYDSVTLVEYWVWKNGDIVFEARRQILPKPEGS